MTHDVTFGDPIPEAVSCPRCAGDGTIRGLPCWLCDGTRWIALAVYMAWIAAGSPESEDTSW